MRIVYGIPQYIIALFKHKIHSEMADVEISGKLVKLSIDNWMETNGKRFPDMKPSEPVRMFKFETDENMTYFAGQIGMRRDVIVRMIHKRHNNRVIRRGKNSAYAAAVVEWERRTKLYAKLKDEFISRLSEEGFDSPTITLELPHPIYNDEITEPVTYHEYYVYFISTQRKTTRAPRI